MRLDKEYADIERINKSINKLNAQSRIILISGICTAVGSIIGTILFMIKFNKQLQK